MDKISIDMSCQGRGKPKEFRTGAFTISNSRNLRVGNHYKAVISEWLAEKNGLSVGDTLTVYVKEGIQMSDSPLKTIGEPIELEIMGQARKVADTEGLLIEADDTVYQASARSYKQTGIFANVFLGIGIVGLGLILCLLLLMRLWIQGREHEAGILLSIGMEKGK